MTALQCAAPPLQSPTSTTSTRTTRPAIVLELAEKGNLMEYLWDNSHQFNNPPSQDLLYRWALQAAEALAFTHSCGVLHSDIHCANFLLDENLNLKVADWAGASIDGGKSWSFYRITHRLPNHPERKVKGTTIEIEIFGLGSALYYMVTGHDIFPELRYSRDKEEIIRRLREREFPDTGELKVLGPVISKCWNLE
jgi:serine/threonine protein kinase